MMTKDQAKLLIGSVGEDIVDEWFEYTKKTEDWYDSKKDGTIAYLTYEVKTLTLNEKYQGFWIEQNQWKKLDGVDLLFFVKVPRYDVSEGLRLYQMSNHRENYQLINHKGRQVRNYLFTKCLPYGIITDDRVQKVLEASESLRTYRG